MDSESKCPVTGKRCSSASSIYAVAFIPVRKTDHIIPPQTDLWNAGFARLVPKE